MYSVPFLHAGELIKFNRHLQQISCVERFDQSIESALNAKVSLGLNSFLRRVDSAVDSLNKCFIPEESKRELIGRIFISVREQWHKKINDFVQDELKKLDKISDFADAKKDLDRLVREYEGYIEQQEGSKLQGYSNKEYLQQFIAGERDFFEALKLRIKKTVEEVQKKTDEAIAAWKARAEAIVTLDEFKQLASSDELLNVYIVDKEAIVKVIQSAAARVVSEGMKRELSSLNAAAQFKAAFDKYLQEIISSWKILQNKLNLPFVPIEGAVRNLLKPLGIKVVQDVFTGFEQRVKTEITALSKQPTKEELTKVLNLLTRMEASASILDSLLTMLWIFDESLRENVWDQMSRMRAARQQIVSALTQQPGGKKKATPSVQQFLDKFKQELESKGIQPDDAYKLFGITEQSSLKAQSLEDLKKLWHSAFRHNALALHPDKEGGDEEVFKKVTKIYGIFNDLFFK